MKKLTMILLGITGLLLILQIPVFQPAKNYSEVKPVDDIYKVPLSSESRDFKNA